MFRSLLDWLFGPPPPPDTRPKCSYCPNRTNAPEFQCGFFRGTRMCDHCLGRLGS